MALTHKATELLRELQRSESLPPYNEEVVRNILEEIKSLFEQSTETLSNHSEELEDNPALACSLHNNHACIERYKRYVLAYLHHRLRQVEQLRWKQGTVLPPTVRENLSAAELDYFNTYSNLLADYMNAEGIDVASVDIAQPPKELYIEVRVLEDLGEVMTSNGPLTLNKNTLHFLPREDVLQYVKEGKMEHIV